MKKVNLKAYCSLNLGDDLFIDEITRRYKHVKFYMFSDPKYKKPFINKTNLYIPSKFVYLILKIFDKFKLTNILNGRILFKKNLFDFSIKIGGSIFIETDNMKFNKSEQKYLFADYIIGANFGPYRTKEFCDFISENLAKIKDCCFRDTYSFELFKHLNNVRVAPDILFSYSNFPKINTGNGIGISVMLMDNRKNLNKYSSIYYSNIIDICNKAQKENIPVTLFSFCEPEGDLVAINKILNRVNDPKLIKVVNYDGDIDVFLNQLNKVEYLIASRFHAMILGWSMKKKVFPILYSKKQKNVINDINFEGNYWNVIDGEKYDSEKLFSDLLNSKQIDLRKIRNQSQKQFEVLDKVLL